jgi:protein involved in polysaccharide export with SLBB domain
MKSMHHLNAAQLSICSSLICLLWTLNLDAQRLQKDPDKYIIGESEKLEIIVHVWGQVSAPGRYVVEDGTDVLELISLAGGPTKYSNLSKVKLTRGEYFENTQALLEHVDKDSTQNPFRGEMNSVINLKKYLDLNEGSMPVLGPGDVVRVPRNTWFGFELVVRVASQLAIVAQVYYWYSRSY